MADDGIARSEAFNQQHPAPQHRGSTPQSSQSAAAHAPPPLNQPQQPTSLLTREGIGTAPRPQSREPRFESTLALYAPAPSRGPPTPTPPLHQRRPRRDPPTPPPPHSHPPAQQHRPAQQQPASPGKRHRRDSSGSSLEHPRPSKTSRRGKEKRK
jgi:hypothetical protein